MNKIIYLLFVIFMNNFIEANVLNDDDNINIDLFNTYNDCIEQNNTVYSYSTYFEHRCKCISNYKCLNNLLRDPKFNELNFEYNEFNFYLNKLNYSAQCQKYNDYFIFQNIKINTFCDVFTILYIYVILFTIVYCVSLLNFKINKEKYVRINNEYPPDYDTLNN